MDTEKHETQTTIIVGHKGGYTFKVEHSTLTNRYYALVQSAFQWTVKAECTDTKQAAIKIVEGWLAEQSEKLPLRNIKELENLSKAHNRKFFSSGALNFFSSRILSPVYGGTNYYYFVTSEKERYTDKPRRYTVRKLNPYTGDVTNESNFKEYPTARQAKKAAKQAANKES